MCRELRLEQQQRPVHDGAPCGVHVGGSRGRGVHGGGGVTWAGLRGGGPRGEGVHGGVCVGVHGVVGGVLGGARGVGRGSA